VAGDSPSLAGQPGPLPLARQRTGAGRCPHHRYPASAASPATRRNAPCGDRACASGQAVLPAPGIVKPRKDHNQGRTSSLRCGRSTLILIFHGKSGAYQGGRKIIDSSASNGSGVTVSCAAAYAPGLRCGNLQSCPE
jgi:hypothetical protein